MKRIVLLCLMALSYSIGAVAQSMVTKTEGLCGKNTRWTFDGYTLTFSGANRKKPRLATDGFSTTYNRNENENSAPFIADYDVKKNIAPWIKEKLNVRRVVIGSDIVAIGSCAFANMKSLQEVFFETNEIDKIGWGAFMNCENLRNISLPVNLRTIETVAFANCKSIDKVEIPDNCRVADQAFMSCTGIRSLEIHPTAVLGSLVFASENKNEDGVVLGHSMYGGVIRSIPGYINIHNCESYGLSKEMVEKLIKPDEGIKIDYDKAMCELDLGIPTGFDVRSNTYVLIIGNQNYRFVPNVPYAIHDARVFGEYCKKTLGVPAANVHITEDATKQMILEEELEDWVSSIDDREDKNLIIYYAGHGVPDIKNKNKAYLLPTDVRGTNPKRGIALDDLYRRLGDLAFNQTAVFIDACFSGLNRDDEGVVEGLRAVEVVAEEATLDEGKLVVFTAAQGNETAQAYHEKGHGLFTYYLLKELHDTYGNASFGELSDRITRNVSSQASQMRLRKSQNPTTNTTQQVSTTWRQMRF